MKRSLKNVIMGVMLFIILLLLAVTVYKATDERIVVSNELGGIGDPGGLAGTMGGTQNSDGSITMPDGTIVFNDGTGILPGMDEIVELPEGTMPEPPGGLGSEPPGDAPGGMMNEIKINSLEIKYYIFFGIQSFLFLLILAYLILTKFNKKEFEETFDDKLKFILLAIITIFGTSIFVYACNFISSILVDKMAETIEEENNNMQAEPPTGIITTPGGIEIQNPTDDSNSNNIQEGNIEIPNSNENIINPEEQNIGETVSSGNSKEDFEAPPNMP